MAVANLGRVDGPGLRRLSNAASTVLRRVLGFGGSSSRMIRFNSSSPDLRHVAHGTAHQKIGLRTSGILQLTNRCYILETRAQQIPTKGW
jgi:hypothetical protein